MKITVELELKDLLELANLSEVRVKQETKRSGKVDIKSNVGMTDEAIRHLRNKATESLINKFSTDCRATMQV